MIDIIIPAYNAHDTICNTLISICIQSISSIVNVYIVNDASSTDYTNIVNLFKDRINIKEIKLFNNSGPGIARQKGIESSNSEYILFLDSDDLLYNIFSLEKLYNEINNCDIVVGGIIDEKKDSISYYSEHMGCLHSKLYRRSFIEKYDIKFNDTRSSEDHSFNRLVLLAEPRIRYIDEPLYVYKYNNNSITERSNKLDDIRLYIYNMEWVVEQAETRNFNKYLIAEFIFSSIMYIYTVYVDNINNIDIYKILDWIKKLVLFNDKYEIELTDSNKFDIYNSFKFSSIPKISLNEFINRVKNR